MSRKELIPIAAPGDVITSEDCDINGDCVCGRVICFRPRFFYSSKSGQDDGSRSLSLWGGYPSSACCPPGSRYPNARET